MNNNIYSAPSAHILSNGELDIVNASFTGPEVELPPIGVNNGATILDENEDQ